jgi:aminoglycoside phosphotransferase (APT) family kinase protein
MSDSRGLDETVSDATVREMVATHRPNWQVRGVERSEHGTDFVATLTVDTPAGGRRVVLKATTADLVDPAVARAEPRLFEFVSRETAIPVPDVYGFRDAHPDLPAPFYLVEYVRGETFENDVSPLSAAAQRRVVETAGEHLAELHECGPLPGVGTVGVRDGDLAVLDTDDHPLYDDEREALYDTCMDAIDALEDGGYFPALADDPARFADLTDDLREHVDATVPALPEPDAPTYCHWDYRYGNLLVDPDTGETTAVLDWANLSASEPANNLANVEYHLLDGDEASDATVAARRQRFRDAYRDARTDDWALTDDVRERMAAYAFATRLGAMACLPLWHEDATPAERDAVEATHRERVRDRL